MPKCTYVLTNAHPPQTKEQQLKDMEDKLNRKKRELQDKEREQEQKKMKAEVLCIGGLEHCYRNRLHIPAHTSPLLAFSSGALLFSGNMLAMICYS